RLSRKLKESRPNRNASDNGIWKPLGGIRKGNCRCRHEPSDCAIGKSRNYIGFEGQCRDSLANCGRHRRAASITADSDQYGRMEFPQVLSWADDRAGKVKPGLPSRGEADSIQRPDLDQSKSKARSRRQAVLKSPCRPKELHLSLIQFLQFLGDRDGGNDVPA